MGLDVTLMYGLSRKVLFDDFVGCGEPCLDVTQFETRFEQCWTASPVRGPCLA